MLSGRKQDEARATESRRELALDYQGQPPIYVCGPVTGRDYAFSSVQPVQQVDARDARFLLASPLFRLSR